MKRLLPLTALVVFLFSASVFAQFEIGASYELRDSEPQNGFGLRIDKGILGSLPLVDLGLRAHFSYFSEENHVDENSYSYSRDFTDYDFGLAAYGGVSLGLLQPYVGLGLGSVTTDISYNDFSGVGAEPEDGDESNIYWNTFAGAKVTVIPMIKPFVEYRYSNKELSDPRLADKQNSRIMFGVSLSF